MRRFPSLLITQIAPSFSVVSYNTPFILPSHVLRTSSYMNFFRIQCDFILCKKKKKKKTQTLFFFIFSFILILFHCCYLGFFYYYHFFFFCVPGCSGMFHVPGFIDGRSQRYIDVLYSARIEQALILSLCFLRPLRHKISLSATEQRCHKFLHPKRKWLVFEYYRQMS